MLVYNYLSETILGSPFSNDLGKNIRNVLKCIAEFEKMSSKYIYLN